MKKGFSLVELLLTIGILAILLTLGTVVFGSFARKDQVLTEARKIGNLINEARMKTVAGYSLGGAQSQNFGVYFLSDRTILFPGLTYDGQNSNNQEFLLPDSIRISPVFLPDNSLVFEKISGEVKDYNPDQNFVVVGDANSSEEKKISVNQLGVVKIEDQ